MIRALTLATLAASPAAAEVDCRMTAFCQAPSGACIPSDLAFSVRAPKDDIPGTLVWDGETLALAHYESSDQGTVLAATAPERAAHLTVTYKAGGRALAYLAEDLRGTGTFEASGQYLGTCEGD